MKYSIIIPAYGKLDLLKKCVESVMRYTSEKDSEIIIVANGLECEYHVFKNWSMIFEATLFAVRSVWYQSGIGYPKAVNEGAKMCKGDYLIFLNNDTYLEHQPVNEWIEKLEDPFKGQVRDNQVGVAGPMKEVSESTGRGFVLFFCAMTPRRLFEQVGGLDETFSPGYCEDVDYCHKVEDMGYRIVQVPDEKNVYYENNRKTGNFMLVHTGNESFKNWPGGEELLRRNNQILKTRYVGDVAGGHFNKGIVITNSSPLKGSTYFTSFDECREPASVKINIEGAKKCDGFMTDGDLTWLAQESFLTSRWANNNSRDFAFCEVGSWHGKSARAIADNFSKDDFYKGSLYCVDHWLGSKEERDTWHQSAKHRQGDAAFYEFMENNINHVQEGRIIPLRMENSNASDLFRQINLQFDLVFIDAGHSYPEVKKDIETWLPLVKVGGILCGHDYVANDHCQVIQAVDEAFGSDKTIAPDSSIWFHVVKEKRQEPKQTFNANQGNTPAVQTRNPCVFDCFPFNNELDVLETRLHELYDVVDRFVIVEAMETHAGKPKPLNFQNNLARFQKFLNKITYKVIERFPVGDPWYRERYQRDFIMQGLTDCQDDDIIIISDCDEVPKESAIQGILANKVHSIVNLEMDLFYYDLTIKAEDKWLEAKVCTYAMLKDATPCGIRYFPKEMALNITDAGWHMSYFGSVQDVIKKIEDTAHQEYNTPEFKNPDVIMERIRKCKDVFGRDIIFERFYSDAYEYPKNF